MYRFRCNIIVRNTLNIPHISQAHIHTCKHAHEFCYYEPLEALFYSIPIFICYNKYNTKLHNSNTNTVRTHNKQKKLKQNKKEKKKIKCDEIVSGPSTYTLWANRHITTIFVITRVYLRIYSIQDKITVCITTVRCNRHRIYLSNLYIGMWCACTYALNNRCTI